MQLAHAKVWTLSSWEKLDGSSSFTSVSSFSFSVLCRAILVMGGEFSSVASCGFSLLCRVFLVMGEAFTVGREQNLPPIQEYFTGKELCITFWCVIINW